MTTSLRIMRSIPPAVTAPNTAIQFLIRQAGRAYTAGPAVDDVSPVCNDLGARGISSTVCYWNSCFDSPVTVADRYLRLLNLIPRLNSDCYLSIKATALDFDRELVKSILSEAARTNTTVHFDATEPESVDRTFALIRQGYATYSKISCTLPGRWQRSLRDVDQIIDLGLRVRVVKGQWNAPRADQMNPRDGFLRVIDRLASKRAAHVAVATHDPELGGESLRRLKINGTPCELELLYGLPEEKMLPIANDLDVARRVYVPCGHPALPYRIREFRNDPRILVWFARDLMRCRRSTCPTSKSHT